MNRKRFIVLLIILMLCAISATVFAKDIDRSEALLIAKQVCEQNHWWWDDKDVEITDKGDYWFVWTFPSRWGSNAAIEVDKKTGKVLRKHQNRE